MFTVECKNFFTFEPKAKKVSEAKAASTVVTVVTSEPAGNKQGFNHNSFEEPYIPDGEFNTLYSLSDLMLKVVSDTFTGCLERQKGLDTWDEAKKDLQKRLWGKAKVILDYERRPILKAIKKFHQKEAANLAWEWEPQDVKSLCNGYKSEFLRKADAAKGLEKKVYYLLSKIMEKEEYQDSLRTSINSAVKKAIKEGLYEK